MFVTRNSGSWLLTIEPDAAAVPLESWVRANRRKIRRQLLLSKAILFRGFHKEGGFAGISEAFFDRRMSYKYRSTPRTDLGQGLYTATEYHNSLSIPQHCENAYQRDWPMQLLFHCIAPARAGGRTPLADTAKVSAMIPAEIKDEFAQKKIMYTRNYRRGVDLPWQEVFGTHDKAEVERFCVAGDLTWEWTDYGLRTTQVCEASARHPLTGERLWFNQAHLFHLSALDPASQQMMLATFGEAALPRNAYFGDGSPIAADLLEPVRSAFELNKRFFDWQEGDVLLVDNMQVAHGREPFEGPRRVLVCMAEPHSEWAAGRPRHSRRGVLGDPAMGVPRRGVTLRESEPGVSAFGTGKV
jgi:alpha-ketoglutarate-dependent taurine dioxygenase